MSERISLPRFCGEGYVARLQRHGYEVIGTGGGFSFPATFVLSSGRDSDAVIKVGAFPAGDPWPLYAEWCIKNPGPLRPAVRSLRWHGKGGGRFFVASMDRLSTPLSAFRKGEYEFRSPAEHRRMLAVTPLANKIIVALSGWYRMLEDRGIDYRLWQHGAVDPRLADRLVKRFMKAGLDDLADFIRRLAAAFPSQMLDPQPHNWMFSEDGRLIFIDPFTRSPFDVPETAPRMTRK